MRTRLSGRADARRDIGIFLLAMLVLLLAAC